MSDTNGKQVIIDNDTNEVIFLEKVITKKVPIDEFYRQLIYTSPIHIPFIPPNCIGVVSCKSFSSFIIEQAPRIIEFRYKPNRTNFYNPMGSGNSSLNGVGIYNLGMPWVYWIVTIQNNPIVCRSVSMIFAEKKVTEERSMLSHMVFPNLGHPTEKRPYGIICLGNSIHINSNLPFSTGINELINQIITSNYNDDYFHPQQSEYTPYFIESAIEEYGSNDFINPIIEESEKIANAKDRPAIYWKAIHAVSRGDINGRALFAWEYKSSKMSPMAIANSFGLKQKIPYSTLLKNLEGALNVE